MKVILVSFFKGFILDAPLQLGFSSWQDFLGGILSKSMLLYTFKWGVIFGAVTAQIESTLGLPFALFAGFILLILGEGYTGIKASLTEGQKIQSRKIGRLSTKIFLYCSMLWVLNMYKGEPIIIGTLEIAFYSWVYWTVFHIISIQLIISILENLGRMGYKETSLVMRLIKGRLKHYIELDKKEYTKDGTTNKVVDSTPNVDIENK